MIEQVRIEGPPGQPIAWVRGDTGWVLVHGRRDPVRDADALLNDLPQPLPAALIVVGLGLGYLVDALVARGWTGRLLALEPEPALVPALLSRPVCAEWFASGRLRVINGPNYRQTNEALAEFGVTDPQPLLHPVLARTHSDSTRRAISALARAVRGVRANQEARSRQASLCLRNTLSNLGLLAAESDVAALDGIVPGMPAIVVAAGPSLDAQLAGLRAAQSRSIVIAVDTALRPLLAAGIRPHFVVSVDPSTTNATHLIELSGTESTWLVAEGSIDPHVMAAFRGRIFAFRVGCRHPWPWLVANGCDCGTLRAWGSVLTTAFDFAVRLGAGLIALAGADLSFTGGRPYCRGTIFEQVWRRAEDWGTPIESQWAANLSSWTRVDEAGVAGTVCHTAPHLVEFRDWIVEQAAALDHLRIINTTGAGILIGPSIEQGSLDVLMSGCAEVEVRPRIAEAWTRATTGRRCLPAILENLSAAGPDVMRALQGWEQATGEPLEPPTAAALLAGVTPAATGSADGGAPFSVVPLVESLPPPPPLSADEVLLQHVRSSLPGHAALVTVGLSGTEANPQALAREALARAGDDGVVALLDRSSLPLGELGRQVARDLVRDDPSLSAEYPWYVDWQRRATIIRRGSGAKPNVEGAEAFKQGTGNREAARDIVEILVGRFSPASVAEIGPGDGAWLDAFRDRGVHTAQAIAAAEASAAGSAASARRADICLCLGVVDHLDAGGAANVIARCSATSDLIVFAAMDPGRGANDVPLARTLGWWAERFLSEGYVLSDELRPAIEARWPLVRGLHDYLVCFRRVMSRSEAATMSRQTALVRAVVALADRIDVLRTRVTAEQIARQHVTAPVSTHAALAIPTVRMTLPRARLHPEPGGTVVFRFRTRAARRWLAHGDAGSLRLLDGEVPLVLCAGADAFSEAAPGHYTIAYDELRFRPVPHSDPRLSGPGFSVTLPQDIAGTESLPLDLIVRHGL